MPAANEVITSRSNVRVKHLRAALSDPSRLPLGYIAIEGEHLVLEAIRSGLTLDTLFLSEHRIPPPSLPSSVEICRLSDSAFSSVSDTSSPQGIAALIVRPRWSLDDLLHSTPLILVAVGLQDPGNLGTLIRSAEAFGATGVAISSGTVNPWNGKTLRSSAGSVFRIPTASITVEDIESWKRRDIAVLATLPTSGALPITSADLTRPSAILIGNEGSGLAPQWRALADIALTIPCPGPVESLNAGVAASILLYEASRQRSLASTSTHPHPTPSA